MPITKDPKATSVDGTEKYLSSLNIEITIMEKTIPIINKIKPGNPRYLKWWLIAINSSKDAITPTEWDIASQIPPEMTSAVPKMARMETSVRIGWGFDIKEVDNFWIGDTADIDSLLVFTIIDVFQNKDLEY